MVKPSQILDGEKSYIKYSFDNEDEPWPQVRHRTFHDNSNSNSLMIKRVYVQKGYYNKLPMSSVKEIRKKKSTDLCCNAQRDTVLLGDI